MALEDDSPNRCDSVFSPVENQRYRCMLHQGHKEEHIWFITWHPEHEGDLMQ